MCAHFPLKGLVKFALLKPPTTIQPLLRFLLIYYLGVEAVEETKIKPCTI